MRRPLVLLLVLVLLAVSAGAAWWALSAARLTVEEARETVVTTIERETAQSFLVVGALDATATVEVTNEKRLLPGSLNLSLGASTAKVRVPGRIAYGFELDTLDPRAVRLLDDGTVEVTLPPLSVLSAEPDLSRLEVETERGWLRSADSMERVEQRATGAIVRALRAQGEGYLDGDATQPRVNAAQAMEKMLAPAFAAAGHPDVRFRFRLSPTLVRQTD
jgi:hypothetical protein